MFKKFLLLLLVVFAVRMPDATANAQTSLPIGDLAGWKQIFYEDFNTPVALGGFPGSAYSGRWSVYLDGWKDSAGQNGAPSRYYPSRVLSVSNGVLNQYLHTENGIIMGAGLVPKLPGGNDMLYGKYTIRFRADALTGYKFISLLWPKSNTWPRDGEIDFPEANLDRMLWAFMHRQNGTSGGDQDYFTSNISPTSWHTASIEWNPDSVVFLLDGAVFGRSTNRIPNTPMHWVLQTESCVITCPSASTAGYLQIDWVAIYSRVAVGIPTNLAATAANMNEVRLSWTAPAGSVDGYRLYRGGTWIGTVSGSTLTYRDTTARACTAYNYTVHAYKGKVEGDTSNRVYITSRCS